LAMEGRDDCDPLSDPRTGPIDVRCAAGATRGGTAGWRAAQTASRGCSFVSDLSGRKALSTARTGRQAGLQLDERGRRAHAVRSLVCLDIFGPAGGDWYDLLDARV